MSHHPGHSGSARPPSHRVPVSTLLISLLVVLSVTVALGCVHVIDRPEETPPAPTAGPAPVVSIPPTPTAMPAPEPTATPVPTAMPTIEPTPVPTPTPIPTPEPTATPLPTPEPTATPVPTAVPTPTPTVTPGPTPTPTSEPEDLPFLIIESPPDRTIVREESVTIQGITSVGASVSVRGRAVAAGEEGRFRLSVPLAPGTNNLDIFAINPDGQRRARTLTVTYLPLDPFFLTITQPDERDREVTRPTVRLWGRTASDATVAVNGIAIPVDQLGIFSTTITLRPGLNVITVVATSTTGDTLQETIEVTFEEQQS